jgi:uncharacterized membrane protein
MMTLITINRVYYLIGFVVMLLVVMTLRDRANRSVSPPRFSGFYSAGFSCSVI